MIAGGGIAMKFYTIKLPKFLGGIVRAVLNSFKKG
ncbi:stage V sporulation protein M [Anoxybacillus tepidamans]|uniref:Stage V sporulation protein M n=1 Tax=Anoxybacteroides tepidamans TaxID=265948 RepID=A0A7W8INF3_9BACL|nr:stage V sporulation protein M [Anoxybacillus tepidamans]